MNPKTLAQLESLFNQAKTLDKNSQKTFIEETCRDNVDLARALEYRLNSDENANGNHSIMEGNMLRPSPQQESWQGKTVGNYKVIKQLDPTGEGNVYLAERCDEVFSQKVAIKFLSQTIVNSDSHRQRFLAERQILARLNHPNIAKVIDGGTTAAGSPFLVMEYIEGKPLAALAEKCEIDLKEKIRLFVKICQAVQYAHQNLVIHQAIKPSNVMITPDGEPKLVDFSIAKTIDKPASPPISQTQTGTGRINPNFVTPEPLTDKSITVRTDVYGLGMVLLHLLLLEQHPFEGTGTNTKSNNRSAGIASKTSTTILSKNRRKQIKGDLGAILNKALHKNPEHRYRTVEALISDLKFFIAKKPISAKPNSTLQRFHYWIRRHPYLTLFLLSLTLIISAWFYRENHLRYLAQVEAAKSQNVTQFFIDLFKEAGPENHIGNELKAKQLLDKGREKLGHDKNLDRQIVITLSQNMARAYDSLGHYDQAYELNNRALQLLNEENTVNQRQVALSQNWLGDLARKQGKLKLGESWLRLSYKTWQAVEPQTKEYFHTLNNLGLVLQELDQVEEAMLYLTQAIKFCERYPGDLAKEKLIALNNKAILYDLAGDSDTAIRLHEHIIKTRHGLEGDLSPSQANSIGNLISLLQSINQREPLEELFKRLLSIENTLYPQGHPNIFYTLNELAIYFEDGNELDKAKTTYEDALSKIEEAGLQNTQVHALLLNNFAVLTENIENHDAALQLYQGSLAIREWLFDNDHQRVIRLYSNISRLLVRQNKAQAARYYLEKADRNTSHNTSLSLQASIEHNYAELFLLENNLVEAERRAKQTQVKLNALFKNPNNKQAQLYVTLAKIAVEKKLPSEALNYIEQAISLRKQLFGNDNPELAKVLLDKASILIKMNQHQQALPLIKNAKNTLDSSPLPNAFEKSKAFAHSLLLQSQAD